MIDWNNNIAFGKKEEAKKDIILLCRVSTHRHRRNYNAHS